MTSNEKTNLQPEVVQSVVSNLEIDTIFQIDVILATIFSFVDLKDIPQICRVCKLWKRILMEAPTLWKSIYLKKFSYILKHDKQNLREALKQRLLVSRHLRGLMDTPFRRIKISLSWAEKERHTAVEPLILAAIEFAKHYDAKEKFPHHPRAIAALEVLGQPHVKQNRRSVKNIPIWNPDKINDLDAACKHLMKHSKENLSARTYFLLGNSMNQDDLQKIIREVDIYYTSKIFSGECIMHEYLKQSLDRLAVFIKRWMF
eukprot:TRINITY_DN10805_c0_g1_i1.p1 TRINITY_DN10805_c0_g1~~TRINITY_DN10805_c0_g1_i1.p1  ORF type:complete len:259 (-),score=33.46 TRINITY_DN10805_c0_g1_i1:160-936(-)